MTRSCVKGLERLTVVWLVVTVLSAVLWLMYQVRTEAGKVTGETQSAVRLSPTSYEAESPRMLGGISGRSREGIVTVSPESLSPTHGLDDAHPDVCLESEQRQSVK